MPRFVNVNPAPANADEMFVGRGAHWVLLDRLQDEGDRLVTACPWLTTMEIDGCVAVPYNEWLAITTVTRPNVVRNTLDGAYIGLTATARIWDQVRAGGIFNKLGECLAGFLPVCVTFLP